MRVKAKGPGRRREFEELTVPHLAALYRFTVQRVRNAAQAEDLVQEACLKAYRCFDRFERGTDAKAWLFRILINTIMDAQRKGSREPTELAVEIGNVEAERSHVLDPERQLMAESLGQEVQVAIEALPQDWQAVVLLSFVEGFTYKEIAKTLDCPIGTVMSRLYRARQALRHRLERHLDVDLRQATRIG
ncbi:MAG: sigma-70 family RNA polymerase sigma factor, partial [Candidatus Methylomirabilis oxyfera]|nr:sigma-70 family RNA polymerase sigma factor [Candidatus Methylomirabilis oxyfera]